MLNHIPGYQYLFSKTCLTNSDINKMLTQFPTNSQISQLLMVAQKRADALVEFAGMQRIPGEMCDTIVANSRDNGQY